MISHECQAKTVPKEILQMKLKMQNFGLMSLKTCDSRINQTYNRPEFRRNQNNDKHLNLVNCHLEFLTIITKVLS